MSTRTLCKAAAAACLLAAAVLAADSPFVGTWKLNSAKSKFSEGAPVPKAVTVRVEAEGNGLKSTVEGTDGEGKPINFTAQAGLDGKPGTVTGSPNYDATTLQRVNEHTIRATASKDGKLVYTDRRVVAKDGKTLTVTRNGTNASGAKYHSTMVFDKE